MESLLAHLARKERTRLRIMRVEVEEQPELAESFECRRADTRAREGERIVDRIDGRASAPKIEAMLAAISRRSA